ncbi:hypothetical protein MYX64_01505 [Nitrospinae bacterium AH_259_B05_G02_I21]|nr:hypothetical protein [Nitrospinae bacterium AH_259_B05_G02_I21]MDA2932589.1 hypothetical protein [Nitrospinae bacterium AH-259-F20]
MSPRGWLPRWLGLILLVVVLCGAAGALGVPWMVDRGLHSAMNRTPYRLAYAEKSFTWPPGILLQEVEVMERTSDGIVATLPSLAVGLALGSGPAEPRWLMTLEAPSITIHLGGAPTWGEENARRLVKNALKNFRSVGLRLTAERVALEGKEGREMTLRRVTGTARATGPDTFEAELTGTVEKTAGLGAELTGPFTSRLTVRRYLDSTSLEHIFDGTGLRVAEAGQAIKKAQAPWQVETTVPWLPTLSLGDNPTLTVMTPPDPRLQALWERW